MPTQETNDRQLTRDIDIRRQLERILAFPELQSSERRRDMLSYIVQEALAGRSSQIKATTIAIAVFGRDTDFDQQSDPVVRLEARKLRRDLDNYYADAGRNDPIKISVPKGRYVPKFTSLIGDNAELGASEGDAASPVGRENTGSERSEPESLAFCLDRKLALAGAAMIAFMVLLLAVMLWPGRGDGQNPTATSTMPQRGVAVLVTLFDVQAPDDMTALLSQGMMHEIAADLIRFPDLRVYTLPGFGTQAEVATSAAAAMPIVDFILTGAIWREADESLVRAELARREDQQVLWSGRFVASAEENSLTSIQDEVSSQIASVVGQQYGHAMQDVRRDLGVKRGNPSFRGFACVASAQIYRRTYRKEEYQAARDCLEETVLNDPDYARAWAMLAYLRNDAARFGHDKERSTEEAFEHARAAAIRALDLDPGDTDALQAMSHVQQYSGDIERAIEYAQKAVEVNSNDPAALANLSIRYAVAGRFEKATEIMQSAIDKSVAPPPFYFHVFAANHLINEEWEDLLVAAERASADDWSFGQALLAIAHTRLDNPRAAQLALDRIAELDPLLNEDPRVWLEGHRVNSTLAEAVVAGLAMAKTAREEAGSFFE